MSAKLSSKEARKIIVQSQLLAGPASSHGVKRLSQQVINHLGYVQIDTISVVERAHHHKFWSRVEGFKPQYLNKLEQERQVFEYWSHAASYLPINAYRYTLPVKAEIAKMDKFWHEKDKKEMARVLERIQKEGQLMSREFEDQNVKSEGGWPMWGPAKRALHDLFMEGKVLIVRREGFQKVYDLPERWLPDTLDTSMPTRKEYLQYLVLRDVRAHGLLRASEFGYLLKGTKKEIRPVLEEMKNNGDLIMVGVKGQPEDYYTTSDTLKLLDIKGYRKRLRILSPFDNLLINRKRTLEMFDFDYQLECYVPKNKRKFGYFSLPVIWGHELIGQLDLKADRKNKNLIIRNIDFRDNFRKLDEVSTPLQAEIARYMAFNSCNEICSECDGNDYVRRLALV